MAAAGLVLAVAGRSPGAGPALTCPHGAELSLVLLAGLAYFVVNFLLVGVAIALHSRASLLRTLRSALPFQALVNLVLIAAAPLVAVVMATNSALLVLLFAFPLAAIYINAAMSVQREHQAHHDELTGLSNRKLLIRQTSEALTEAARPATKAGFLLLDLDRFKEVNDTLGHPVGDRLLRIVAHRLTHSVRPGDLVARLGGDEFAVLLPVGAGGRRGPRGGRPAAGRALRADPARGHVVRDRGQRRHRAVPGRRDRVRAALQRADVAMYLAKERRSGVERYVADSDRNSPARLALLGDLRRGMDRGELELHYQPKVNLADRPDRRDGGAGPLAAPGTRADGARRVHPAGRAVLPDARAHATWSDLALAQAVAVVAGRHAGSRCRSTWPPATCSTPASPRPSAAGSAAPRPAAGGAAAGDQRAGADQRARLRRGRRARRWPRSAWRSASTTSAPATPRWSGSSGCRSAR